MQRLLIAAGVTLAVGLSCAGTAAAAAPDGAGPWADSFSDVEQGIRDGGDAVPATRSDPSSALGVAEDSDVEGTFFTLGFGGRITLGFDNRICNKEGVDLVLELHEVTREPYPDELVDVYVSEDGTDFVLAASAVNKDATIDMPDSVPVARYVKLVDVTSTARNDAADGYDVDGVKALDTDCEPPPLGKMKGWGVFSDDGKHVAHAFKLHCDTAETPNYLVVGWKEQVKTYDAKKKKWVYTWKAYAFELKTLDEATCTDDPSIDEGTPEAGFDTHSGKGTGNLNGKSGYTIEWVLTDAGEPGTNDTAKFLIKDSNGNAVLDVGASKICGEHEALPAPQP